jgi:hypothetical protein
MTEAMVKWHPALKIAVDGAFVLIYNPFTYFPATLLAC